MRTIGLAGLLAVVLASTAYGAGPQIHVLSDRADLISGGDALVAIDSPATVTLDGRDITDSFATRSNGSFEGLVTGLSIGDNVLTATLPDGSSDQVTLVDHSDGGPVFSGPQIQPWVCQNGSKDPQCAAPTTFAYQYKSSVTGQFGSYDPANPPSDVASTTTDNGQTVPYIVRVETGYQDRDQYQIATLFQPGKPWTAWDPQPQFDHKLLITHGASCGIDHQSATAPSVIDDTALSRGFAVMSTALDNAGHNCNIVTEAESLVMAKEHLIEQYGTLRYTIGTGCSGGSLVQQQVANAYPGIYQGILPQCSFQDAWSNAQEISDYHLTRGYFEDPSKWGTGIIWTPNQIAAVEGHPNHGNAIIFDTTYWTSLAVPDDGCPGVATADDYNAQSNPGGVRCTLADYMINVFGPRPSDQWGPQEQQLGHGFAGLAVDNVGVQYGLTALKQGVITPSQFADLNSKIGGEDIDINPTADRFTASTPALARSYTSGAINETNNLKNVAIIDLRGPDPGAFHDVYRTWSIRARLEREEGHFPVNHVIWFGPTPLLGSPQYQSQGVIAMDEWLSAVEKDDRDASLEQKVAEDRPSDVHDKCAPVDGVEQVAVPGVGPVCELDTVQTKFSTPRVAAGEGITTDQQKCQLQPLRQSDFYPLTFTPDQWSGLQKALPTGVCDFAKPGVDQTGTVPWQTYQSDAAGDSVVYGGQPLGPAPNGSGSGWTSPTFDGWRGVSGAAAVKKAAALHPARHISRR
jgi:hypothetical protein